MCGFAGFLSFNNQGSGSGSVDNLQENSMRRALATLENRGPDAQGLWKDDSLWLGHRRLSVVDRNVRGNQPFERSNLLLVFNGMIYNYREIRGELIKRGYQFSTDTDTEVIINGWTEWQLGLLERLNGMFAFAIWDKAKKKLFLVRDRFGKKPLYYRQWRSHLAFGSRFDTVEALTESETLSPEALSWLLTLKYIPDPLSASREIKKVPPGHIISISKDGGVDAQRWYRPLPNEDFTKTRFSKKNFRMLMSSAVNERLVSDVPVACFLSGGIDSAIVAALARESGTVDTFTVGFDNSRFDESKLARETAKYLGTSHHEVHLTINEQLGLVDQLLNTALDEPFGDSSALPSLFISNEMKKVATVALSGDGADELFGGYRKYQGELVIRFWEHVPLPLRASIKLLISGLPKRRSSQITENFRRFDRFLSGAELDPVARHAAWMSAGFVF